MVSFHVFAKPHSRRTHKSYTTSALPLPCSLFNSPSKIPVVSRPPVTKSPVVHPLSVQLLTKCYSRNSFVLKMIHFDGGVYTLRPFLPTFLGTPLHIFAFSRIATLLFSIDCALFCTVLQTRRTQLFSFQSIPHSFAKTPGGGHVLKENRLAVVAFTRRGGLLRRNSSTTDSRNGQLFSVERFFPDASSTASISARPRRRFLLRNKRKTSQKPGGSFSCAFAAPASASGTASANFLRDSGSIAPRILVTINRLRMPRIASGVFEASTTISRTLLPPSSTPRSNSSTPRSCRPCRTSKPASIASACSAGACSNRESSSSRGSRLGNSRGIGRAMFFLLAFTSFESARARYQMGCYSPRASTSSPLRRRPGALDGRSGDLRAAADFRRLLAIPGDERKPLCTRACASLGPCGCSSAGLQGSRRNSWACRVRCPAPCR